jgi:hypothetical protein
LWRLNRNRSRCISRWCTPLRLVHLVNAISTFHAHLRRRRPTLLQCFTKCYRKTGHPPCNTRSGTYCGFAPPMATIYRSVKGARLYFSILWIINKHAALGGLRLCLIGIRNI